MTRTPILALGLAVITVITANSAVPAVQNQANDEEQQIGQASFDELKAKREVIAASPLYDLVLPIGTPIAKSAQPRYQHPFHFYLVHERQPNAFSVPGGHVYITDEMLYFVRNSEELAGTLCHEIAHTVSRDSMKLMEKEEQIARRQVGAAILLGPSAAQMIAIALIGKLRTLSYSRDVESAADLTGADICAASGWNPWGMVWLFDDFGGEGEDIPQMLSDHPGNAQRVAALKKHFRDKPAVFGAFSSDRSRAKVFAPPKDASVVFLR